MYHSYKHILCTKYQNEINVTLYDSSHGENADIMVETGDFVVDGIKKQGALDGSRERVPSPVAGMRPKQASGVAGVHPVETHPVQRCPDDPTHWIAQPKRQPSPKELKNR
jgi:hypothetical protein